MENTLLDEIIYRRKFGNLFRRNYGKEILDSLEKVEVAIRNNRQKDARNFFGKAQKLYDTKRHRLGKKKDSEIRDKLFHISSKLLDTYTPINRQVEPEYAEDVE